MKGPTCGPSSLLFLLAAALLHGANARLEGEICLIGANNCDPGLECASCVDPKTRCTRVATADPKTKNASLPFNKYSWLTTHNSFAQGGIRSFTGQPRLTFSNQEDSITAQLVNGVRGLMLDLYDFGNETWLCHSYNATCFNFTAFQPAINVLQEVQAFLQANPTEIVTIFIEDYVYAPKGLTKLFEASGLRKYMVPVASMPKDGSDWPSVAEMASAGQQLVVFTSRPEKEEQEGIAYWWRYVVENRYGDDGMRNGSCQKRPQSQPLNSSAISLFLLNHFPDTPSAYTACQDNSETLLQMLDTCHVASGKWPNFIAVDFYKRSTGGGAPQAMDTVNDALTSCKDNGASGNCNGSQGPANPQARPPTSPQSASTTLSGGQCLRWWGLIWGITLAWSSFIL